MSIYSNGTFIFSYIHFLSKFTSCFCKIGDYFIRQACSVPSEASDITYSKGSKIVCLCILSFIFLVDFTTAHSLIRSYAFVIFLSQFQKSDVPSWSPGKGRSYIDMAHLEVRSTCDPSFPKDTPISIQSGTCGDTKFEVLMFEAPADKPWYEPLFQYTSDYDVMLLLSL